MPKRGEFASYDQDFVRKLVKAGIAINNVYDIGASNGYWSWLIATVVPHARFHLFEPLESDQYAEGLARVLQDRPDFRMHRVGLGNENTTLRLNLHKEHVGSTLLDSDWEGVVAKKPVPVRRLDDLVRELALPVADIIKMDTQGFELKILNGGESTCRSAKALMLETWLYRAYGPGTPLLSEIIEWLAARNFSLVSMGDVYVAPDLTLTSVDAFFLRSDVMAQAAATSGVSFMSD